MNIIKPTLIIDRDKAKNNIASMVKKAKSNGLKFRPHFKTHQSIEVGEWFREQGVKSITVSSLEMAEYFANSNWEEITVAFPCNILQIDLINKLAAQVNLILLVDNMQVVNQLNDLLQHEIEVFIELDTGNHRTGVQWDNQEKITGIVRAISSSASTKLKGFYCHAGHSYSSKNIEKIKQVYTQSIERIAQLKTDSNYSQLEFCYGDTPTCSVIEQFEQVDALSAGNFVFYDIMQQHIGSCAYDDISVAMACPVVSINHERQEVCIYGGAVHFSKDYITENNNKIYGKLVDWDGKKWGKPSEDCFIKSLSQEHGLVNLSKERIAKLKVGDVLFFLPVHSCLTAECMKRYTTYDERDIDHL